MVGLMMSGPYGGEGKTKSPQHAIQVDTAYNDNTVIAGNALGWSRAEKYLL